MIDGWPPTLSRRAEVTLVGAIVLVGFLLRVIAPWYAPHGWRDDELSSALVVTGHVLEGDFRIYYPDASGHEGLYEYAQAATMLIFGPSVWGIRGPSILFGTVAVLLTYLLARNLSGWPTATVAASLLAVSFWSLMYSRTGQRHISATVTMLLSFYFLWQAVRRAEEGRSRALGWFALAGLAMGLGFYTYFAARGVPLIVGAWGLYLLVWRRDWWQAIWHGLAVTLVIALALGIPLALTLWQQPEAEARISEVARPIHDATQGDFSTLGRYALTTLSMFTHDGDEEWLYNIPHRPVFGALGGVLLWGGVGMALVQSLGWLRDPRMAFSLVWLLAGIAPGALSVPAASLGHTILAQPVAMIFPALAINGAGYWLTTHAGASGRIYPPRWLSLGAATVLASAITLLGWETLRGIRDYFFVWPADPFTRVLHHSDLHEAARWLNMQSGNRNVAIGSFLVERWDQQVMKLDLVGDGWRVRSFDPRITYLQIPGGGVAVSPEYLAHGWGMSYLGEIIRTNRPYVARAIEDPGDTADQVLARFDNGLVLSNVRTVELDSALVIISVWRAERSLDLPPFPLLSKPPAPGEDDTPRLSIFFQLLNSSGQRIAGADGLGVDPYTLYPGDVFVQRLDIQLTGIPPGRYALVVGLYNPANGRRHLDTLTQQDHVALRAIQIPPVPQP